MLRVLAGLLVACAPFAAPAQSIEPGLWEYTDVITDPRKPALPTIRTQRRCLTKAVADSVERWGPERPAHAQCTVKVLTSTATTATWEFDCPRLDDRGGALSGTGSAAVSPGMVESEHNLTVRLKGNEFKSLLKRTGKHHGPCN